MKIWLLLTGSLSALFLSAAADAQVTLDVAQITCKQFVIGDVVPTRSLSLWLSGYYHGKRDVTVINPVTLNPNSEKVKDYCIAHQDEMVLKAVEAVLGK
jgi:acid stress chaperone HdeB